MKNRKLKALGLLLTMLLVGIASAACGKDTKEGDKEVKVEVAVTPTPTEVPPGHVEADASAVQVEVNNGLTYQTIEGFGACYSWYAQWLTFNANKSDIYDLLFKDAKLSVLRFKNTYKYDESREFNPKSEIEIYNEAKKRINEYGEEPNVLMSSWSPAGYLKESDVVYGGSSIRKDEDGYVYDEYGAYWAELVKAYEDKGINIDKVSIQNECDFVASYDGCEFSFTETDTLASYAKAYLATYNALKSLENPPLMMGPETMTVDAKHIELYMKEIFETAPESVYGIAHHLYSGGSHTDPGSFSKNFIQLNNLYPNLSKWQTEFYRGDFIQTAEIIQNSLVYENLNAYLFWGGVWQGDGQCLISLDVTKDPEEYTYENGYQVNEQYYALRHFSEFIRPGYKRVDVAVKDNKDLSVSTFVSDTQDTMVAVAINTGKTDTTMQLQFTNYQLSGSKIYISNCSGEYVTGDLYKDGGALATNQSVVVPANSIMTVVMNGTTNVETTSGIGINDAEGKIIQADVAKATDKLDWKEDAAWKSIAAQKVESVANGDHGASAEFKTLWTESTLYVRVDVADDTSNVSSKDYIKQDNIDIYLNESNSKQEKYGVGDMHFKVSRGDVVKAITGVKDSEIEKKVTTDDKGYHITLAIPLKTIKASAGTKMGFDLQVNDSQSGESIAYILKWSDTSLMTGQNLEEIGTLTLK